MAIPRKYLIGCENTGYFDLIIRCFKQVFICELDPETDKDKDNDSQFVANLLQ
jgi:hypothetical protein